MSRESLCNTYKKSVKLYKRISSDSLIFSWNFIKRAGGNNLKFTKNIDMSDLKNTPPKGVIIAVSVIILLVLFYFVMEAMFPQLFQNISTGDAMPVQE